MLEIKKQQSLRAFNTLALDVKASHYSLLTTESDLPALLSYARQHHLATFILGEGSNSIFSGDFDGLVIHMALRGIQVQRSAEHVIVTVDAGENWHDLVRYCLGNHYYGLENLILIPGSVGAAAIQNLGAYGVELCDVFESLRGWDHQQQCFRTLTMADCDFAYRDSVFKHALKGCFTITQLSLRLALTPSVKTTYPRLQTHLQQQGITDPTPQQVAAAVMAIRRAQLPDPAVLPNVGSFFKNPIVSEDYYQTLLRDYPMLVAYPQTEGKVKLAAGQLLELAGWKGKQKGPVGMHKNQALILVNQGGASGEEVLAWAQTIQRDINDKYGIDLVIEPSVV